VARAFFEGFRAALAEWPDGLVRTLPPATAADIAAAERALGPLPVAYTRFLRSFDGADLFHESIVICGVGAGAFQPLASANRPPPSGARPGDLVFATTSAGDTLLLAPPTQHSDDNDNGDPADFRVIRLRADSEERWLSGSDFPHWLDATLARERVLYDDQGEFLLEAFEPDGEELTTIYALRRSERALRKDPGSAENHHDQGIALRSMGRLDGAATAFARAAALDPGNPWPWFDLGRVSASQGNQVEAADAFRRAAEAQPGPEGARFLAHAARAAWQGGQRADADSDRREAARRHPAIAADLRRAAEAAAEAADDDARIDAEALAAVFDGVPLAHRLPILPAGAEKRDDRRGKRRS